MRRLLAFVGTTALLAGALVVFTVGVARADDFMVTNGDDTGDGSLRQAFQLAQTNPGDDVIMVDDAVNTITLTTTELSHTPGDSGNLTLQGNGVTIQQTAANRVINNGGGTLTLDSATVTGGNVTGNAGGISSNGAVVLTDSTVTTNQATGQVGGVSSNGAVTLTNSTVSGNTAGQLAGGVSAGGAATLTGSTVSGNTSQGPGGYGTAGGVRAGGAVSLTDSHVTDNTSQANDFAAGGIYAGSSLTITTSTVDLNDVTAPGGAGGVFSDGAITVTDSTIGDNTATSAGFLAGGGVMTFGTSISATRSTINGNTATSSIGGDAGGGVVTQTSEAVLTNSTVEGNTATTSGAGVGGVSATVVTLTHATVVGNIGPDAANVRSDDTFFPESFTPFASVVAEPSGGGANCLLGTNGTTSSGYNFADDTSCSLSGTGDDQDAANDPMLGTLGNNGGPTETRLPQTGSPLIDMIPSGSCNGAVTTDQRSLARPSGTGCDGGSVEVQAPPPPPPPPPPSGSGGGTCGTGAAPASVGPVSLGGGELLFGAAPLGAQYLLRRRRTRWTGLLLLLVVGAGVVVLAGCVPLKGAPPPC